MSFTQLIAAAFVMLAASAAYTSLRYSDQKRMLESISGALILAGLGLFGGSLHLFH